MFKASAYASRPMCTGLMLAGLAGLQPAQAQPVPQGIYTCVDARGRKLTSDRPIPECTDREQKVLNPSGTVKSKVGPTLTAQERVGLEAKEKTELEVRALQNEEKRRDRALQTRYPTKAVHDKERAEAQAQIRVVRQASVNRLQELLRQRAIIDTEMEFYKKDPNKAPPSVRRQMDDVNHSMAVQVSFIADQDAALKRVSARFDEVLLRLKPLWALQSPASAAVASKPR